MRHTLQPLQGLGEGRIVTAAPGPKVAQVAVLPQVLRKPPHLHLEGAQGGNHLGNGPLPRLVQVGRDNHPLHPSAGQLLCGPRGDVALPRQAADGGNPCLKTAPYRRLAVGPKHSIALVEAQLLQGLQAVETVADALKIRTFGERK